MHINPALLFTLITLTARADAVDVRGTLLRATERVHNFALKHSAGLARDLRLVLRSLDQQPLSKNTVTHRVYCTRAAVFDPNNTSPANPPNESAGGNRTATATATGGAPRPTATSLFTLVDAHVSSVNPLQV